MNNLGTRLKAVRKEAKLSQEDLAKKVGVSQTTVSDIERGRNEKSADIVSFAKALGVEALWLANGKGSKYPDGTPTFNREDAPLEGLVFIPEYRVSFSAGNGTIHYEEITESRARAYEEEWFRRERINPKHTKRFKVHGDSMETTLYSEDSILVNLDENDPNSLLDGKIYAIRYGNELRVKRLFRKFDGTIVLHSDNPAYKEDEIPPDAPPEQFSIIGRVRDKSGKGGL